MDTFSSKAGVHATAMKDMNQDGNTTSDEMERVARNALSKGETVSSAAVSRTRRYDSSEASVDSEISNDDIDSSVTDASDRNEATNTVVNRVQSSWSPEIGLDRATLVVKGGGISRRRNPSPFSSENDQQNDDDTITLDRESKKPSPPQHDDVVPGEMTTDRESRKSASPQNEDVVAPNTFRRDMDFEVALLSQRNKRVLISRLEEVLPRGRLSLVRYCFANKLFVGCGL